jgi:hypothetical protein
MVVMSQQVTADRWENGNECKRQLNRTQAEAAELRTTRAGESSKHNVGQNLVKMQLDQVLC